MPKRIQLQVQMPPEFIEPLKGRHLNERYYDRVISGKPADIYAKDGSLLGLLRPGALPMNLCEAAYPALHKIGRRASDRGRQRGFKTAIVGFMEDGLTALTRNDFASWRRIQPYIRACNRVCRQHNPQLERRYVKQWKAANSNPGRRIGSTAFSTMAINLWDERQDGRSPAHPDDRDLPEGFAVISVFDRGCYEGGYLIFPAHRVAFDLRMTDVLLYDPLQMHGNAPVTGRAGWLRLSTVLFYLARLQGSPSSQ